MDVATFQKEVWDFYRTHGRKLPWRTTVTPYRIFVSEVMLQQTQVDRVIPKFFNFVRTFPSFRKLAQSRNRDVIAQWQGLGYNRRALYLKRSAEEIRDSFSGRVPESIDTLESFPGIGPYTARAILAFAYNQPVPLIETNVRTALFHHFFSKQRPCGR